MSPDADHPWFRPLWTRIAVTVVCALWAGLEWWGGEPFWGTIATGMTGYAAWTFLLRRREDPPGGDLKG